MDCKDQTKAALIISHPGHELRVHHWMETSKPLVLVLTDGSGSVNRPRLSSTITVLKNTGARSAGVFGRFSDNEMYEALIRKNMPLLCGLLHEVVSILEQEQITLVVGDALEYYNPSHDLCRYITGAAVEIVQRRTGVAIRNFDFSLVDRPDACPPELRERALWISLDESGWERKLAASRGYPELAGEVEATLRAYGEDIFRKECLRPVANNAGIVNPPSEQPFYERHGEKRVRDGVYLQVIRYCNHMQPIAEALWEQALRTA